MHDAFEQWWAGIESTHPIQYSTAKRAWNAAVEATIAEVQEEYLCAGCLDISIESFLERLQA